MSKKFIQVIVEYSRDESILEILTQNAFEKFNCGGTQNFDFNEQEVDKLLGKDAFVGGDLPTSIIDKIEKKEKEGVGAMLFYFYDEDTYKKDAENFVSFIAALNKPEITTSSSEKNWDDWNATWRNYYKPIVVSENISVFPAWEKANHLNRNDVVWINPGMGFGTGTHETTFLCLKILDHLVGDDLNTSLDILDLGCGSGILGIAAMKLTKCHVHFCDIDRNALDNCVENLELNFPGMNLQGTVVSSREKLDCTNDYDLIFANILEPVLLEERDYITEMSKKDSKLIISGILENQYKGIIDAYQKVGWKNIKVESKNEWFALLMVRDV